jgi:hypothetical protein
MEREKLHPNNTERVFELDHGVAIEKEVRSKKVHEYTQA